jgi:hypothetical protein
LKGEIKMKMIKRNAGRIATLFVATMLAATSVFASLATSQGVSNFTVVMKFIATWTTYLGAGIAFFGAIQLAFGFRSDDAEGKNKGLRSMIAGIIVIAIALGVGMFLSMGQSI